MNNNCYGEVVKFFSKKIIKNTRLFNLLLKPLKGVEV